MVGYLICEDGPQVGLVIHLESGNEWIIGRDPNTSFILLEDPMVSRKHGIIHLKDDLFSLENLSEVNPIKVNGEIQSTFELHEDDTIQIGNNYFRFTKHSPDKEKPKVTLPLEAPSILPFTIGSPSRFFIKVLSGPNQGAEFGMDPGSEYTLGKDASSDIVFQDLSVSHKHAKLSISSSGAVTIEDLKSKNGIIINGLKIDIPHDLPSGAVVSLGTTIFLFVDKEKAQETIYSPPPRFYEKSDEDKREELETKESVLPITKNWKETFIPTKHLVLASFFSCLVLFGLVSLVSLFRSQPISLEHVDTSKQLGETIAHFSNIQYSFNPATGKLFLVGHVLTDIEYAELNYLLNSLPFITQIEDTVIIDEGVWQDMNALLSKNPNWRGITMSATSPGHFVLKGYLASEADAIPLQDYINLNFPYLNLLNNQVIVENTLQIQVGNLLIENGFTGVDLQMGNGEILMTGKVAEKRKSEFQSLIDEIGQIRGVRFVKNYVVYASAVSSIIDLTTKYHVMGTSKLGNVNQYVLISGKILAIGDTLDGMMITSISTDEILLDKDGIKYKIDYNQQ